MTEIFFYHLERQPLDRVLPTLLEKSIERGWRAAVEVGAADQLKTLDDLLWTYRDDSFLPHGLAGNEDDALQPVLITDGPGNANNAQVRFFVGGALPRADTGYDRLVFMFDGHDPDRLQAARGAWRALAAGNAVTYWQQSPEGGWIKKA